MFVIVRYRSSCCVRYVSLVFVIFVIILYPSNYCVCCLYYRSLSFIFFRYRLSLFVIVLVIAFVIVLVMCSLSFVSVSYVCYHCYHSGYCFHYHSLSFAIFVIVHYCSFSFFHYHSSSFGIVRYHLFSFIVVRYYLLSFIFFSLLLIIIHYYSSYHVRYHSLSPVIVSGMTLTLTMPLTADCCNPVCLCLFLSGAHVSALLSLKIGLSAADTRSIRRSVEENRHGDVSTNYSPPFFSKVKVKWIDNKMNQMGL